MSRTTRALRTCKSCGARHVFLVETYRGRRLHPGVKETLHLGCRACGEPMFDWVDEDGDHWQLFLEGKEPVAAPRERRRTRRFHPMMAVGLVCAAVLAWVLYLYCVKAAL